MMTTEKISADTRREHIEELAAAYSLGALTDHNDLEEFQQLVESGDPALAASLEEMLEASSALAIAAPIAAADRFASHTRRICRRYKSRISARRRGSGAKNKSEQAVLYLVRRSGPEARDACIRSARRCAAASDL